jgi:hypothetical protein
VSSVLQAEPIRLPSPLPRQIDILNSDSSRKVLRCGRRFGKSRFAMIAALAGHGPGNDGEKLFPGVLQGKDIVWVAQDYPNLSTVMWREEFLPRFKHLPYVTMNGNDHFISFDGLGTLFLRPETAIGGIRGIGKNLGGVILDEAAFYDLESALQDVIMPALLDNNGWFIIMSTTNAGPDGNAAKRVPSYFNLICEEIRAGQRSADWQEFTGTAFDNPRLSQKAIDELIKEYPPESPKLKQEVYAELLRAGIGLALSEVSADKHIVSRFPIPDYWTHFGAFDWGYNHPWAFGWFAVDTDSNIYLVDTIWGREEQPDRIANKVRSTVPLDRLKYIHAGHDCWEDRKARGENVPTLAEQFYRHGWKRLAKANISRVSGLNNLREYVHWQATETEPERTPRFRMFDTDGNRRVLAQLQAMQIDPKDLEDALKMDADQAGRGGDDGYDMVRYGLASRPLKGKIGVQYEHHDAPHHDPHVQLKTIDGQPPRWIGPEHERAEGFTEGFASQLPVGI